MSVRECSQCGVSAPGFSWGFALLARDGWSVAAKSSVSEARERAWLCPECGERAQSTARGMASLFAPRSERQAANRQPVLKVLLVDDQVLMLRCLMRLLQGYETVVADSPDKALALLRSGIQFDAIVCDVMMPGMTGPELYARACLLNPNLARRFVFVSNDPFAARPLLDRAAAHVGIEPAPALLAKPTSRAELTAAIAAIAPEAHESAPSGRQHPARLGAERQRSTQRSTGRRSPSRPDGITERKVTRDSQISRY